MSSATVSTTDPVARGNIAVIEEFFSLYLGDIDRFYALWVDDEPEVVTPYVAGDVAHLNTTVHRGWEAVRAFWDPIHGEMEGKFDWFLDELLVGEDPDVIVVRSHSDIDVRTGPYWGGGALTYQARYVQIFRFCEGRIRSFEEYFDTVRLNAAYSG